MVRLENQWLSSPTRRRALQIMGNLLAGSPLLFGQQDPFRDSSRVPGLNELVNAFDFEAVAYARLPRDAYDYTALGVSDEFTLRLFSRVYRVTAQIPPGV